MKVNWLQYFDNSRKDSIWYGGDLVRVQVNKRYEIVIGAFGDVGALINDEYYKDNGNGGRFAEYLEEEGIHNDKELQKAIKENRIQFENNNWFEAWIWDNEEKDWINDSWESVIDELDANDFSWVKGWLKKQLDWYNKDK